MSTDLFKRINCTALYPPLVSKIQALAAACQARGVDYWAISGERTHEEQNALYAQGRTKPGNIVTNAKGGQSMHNFAIAVDFCKDKDTTRDGLQPDYTDPAYTVLGEEAAKVGLEWGGKWKFKDLPHVQLPIGKVGLKLFDLQQAYAKGGKAAVFALLDKYRW